MFTRAIFAALLVTLAPLSPDQPKSASARTAGTPFASPLTGTWRLNLAKSKYDPANFAPKSSTTRYDVSGDTVTYTSEGISAKGQVIHTDWIGKIDGKAYPQRTTVDGQLDPGAADSVIVRKIDDHTYELLNKLKGHPLYAAHIVIAPDGKSRMATAIGRNAEGVAINHTQFWDRQ